MLIFMTVIVALLIDYVFGEPKRWHPLVGFGNIAHWLENKLNNFDSQSSFLLYVLGILAWVIMVIPFVVLVCWISQLQIQNQFLNQLLNQEQSNQVYFTLIIDTIVLTFALGTKSLVQHARAVSKALEKQDVILARKKIGLLLSRDTSASDEAAITKASIESVLENGSDAVFAAIFWFVVLGAPGVILYRLANTLDAMWGYKTERFTYFGWAAARIDDVLNWFPARLTALSYALAGNTVSALSCWHKQSNHWHGLNPGVVMASGAGALKISLGGPATYHGKNIERPKLGCVKEPKVADIEHSIKLVYKSIFIWIAVIAVGEYFIVW